MNNKIFKAILTSLFLSVSLIVSYQAKAGMTVNSELVIPASSTSGLVGDEIDAEIIRTITSGYSLGRICCYGLDAPFVVESGVSDRKVYSSVFTLDVNAFNFELDYIPTAIGSWQDGIVFRLSSLDFHSGANYLSGVDIDTDVSGLTWVLGEDYIDINLGGTSISRGSYIYGEFLVSNVPEPNSYVLLFAGLGFVSFVTRRKGAKK